MKKILMMSGGKKLVDVCTKVQAEESVLIITDMEMKLSMATVLAQVAKERGADVTISIITPRERDGQEPPKSVAAAMKEADVIFTPVKYSITHTSALKNAVANGARAVVMTDFTEDIFIRGGMEANFEDLKPICKKVAAKLAAGKHLKLTSPAGTDLEMDISGRRGNSLYGIVEPGEFTTAPTVEANVSPVSANGQIVVDASIPYLGIGVIDEPIHIEVKKGFITKINGNQQARILKDNLKSHNDKNVYNIAELGLGLNPHCVMIGYMLEDEGVMGTAHIGIGTSANLGGTIRASCHYDLIMWKARVEVDGVVIIEDEEVRI
jgi:leucyl aminopeptidase (aminopeptidase T)